MYQMSYHLIGVHVGLQLKLQYNVLHYIDDVINLQLEPLLLICLYVPVLIMVTQYYFK